MSTRLNTYSQVASQLAQEFRNEFECDGGVVVTYAGEACGWVNELRNPESWKPGSIAVDEQGNQWVATGGGDYNGAKAWEAVARPEVSDHDLKACPFCGENPTDEYPMMTYCENTKCPIVGVEILIDEWNTRPVENRLQQTNQ